VSRSKALETIKAFCEVTGLSQSEVIALVKNGIKSQQKINQDFGLNKRFFGLIKTRDLLQSILDVL
jgi:hypothetical protein